MGNQHSSNSRHPPNLQQELTKVTTVHNTTCTRPANNCQQNTPVLNSRNKTSVPNPKLLPTGQQRISCATEAEKEFEGKMNKVNPKPSDGAKAMVTAGSKIILTSNYVSSGLEKFVKCLVECSGESGMITKEAFQKFVIPMSIAGEYVWDYFTEYIDTQAVSEGVFLRSADRIYGQITDKSQVQFYLKVFAKGNEVVTRHAFRDFLRSSYQLSSSLPGKATEVWNEANSDDLEDGKDWIESVTKSCFHVKDEMSVLFLSNWMLNHLPRVVLQMHKFIVHQLTTGYQTVTKSRAIENNGASKDKPGTNSEELGPTEANHDDRFCGINRVLLHLLSCSLPEKYLGSFKNAQRNGVADILNPKTLLEMISKAELEGWTMLYNTDEHGTSINRFQHHVYNYKGPSLMFITADNGYQICLGSDTEWKESCHFWGGEDSIIVQLKPEFRIVEKGGKSMYSNFSIRGYAFGIQAGKDPRNVSVEVKPDFQYMSFKKIPCKLEKLVVYGCGTIQAKNSQADYKKWEAKESHKQKKVNLNSAEWKDNPDKYLLELGGNYRSYGNN